MYHLGLIKVFDLDDHDNLDREAETLQASERASVWAESFHREQKFSLRTRGHTMASSGVLGSVSKGLLLGPTLFLIFVNDLTRACATGAVFSLMISKQQMQRWRRTLWESNPGYVSGFFPRIYQSFKG